MASRYWRKGWRANPPCWAHPFSTEPQALQSPRRPSSLPLVRGRRLRRRDVPSHLGRAAECHAAVFSRQHGLHSPCEARLACSGLHSCISATDLVLNFRLVFPCAAIICSASPFLQQAAERLSSLLHIRAADISYAAGRAAPISRQGSGQVSLLSQQMKPQQAHVHTPQSSESGFSVSSQQQVPSHALPPHVTILPSRTTSPATALAAAQQHPAASRGISQPGSVDLDGDESASQQLAGRKSTRTEKVRQCVKQQLAHCR